MRYREPFTVFKRVMKSGKTIWYYYTYDDDGKRTVAHSTGQLTKSAARAYCFQLLKKDALIPNTRGRMTFAEYAKDWWDWDKCQYVAYRKSRRNLSKGYADTGRRSVEKHLVPQFGKKRLMDITSYEVESWLLSFAKKGLRNQTANTNLAILRVMLGDAVRRGLIETNPIMKVKPLKKNSINRGILPEEMVEKLFDAGKIDEIWEHRIYYIANLTAAFTGMRMGELMAVQTKDVTDGCISVSKQFSAINGLMETKNHKARMIPLNAELEKLLDTLKTDEPETFLFSLANRTIRPLGALKIRGALYQALEKVGMSRDEQKDQNITFHSWRHYFNTMMIRNNVPEQKIRMMTGHSSAAMTEHYTHMDHTDLEEVKEIQNQIINFPKTSKVG